MTPHKGRGEGNAELGEGSGISTELMMNRYIVIRAVHKGLYRKTIQ